MHFIGLCLHEIRWEDQSETTEEGIDKARVGIDKMSDLSLKSSCIKGLELLRFIREEDAMLLYSPITALELIVGRGRGLAIERAAKEGMPDRMWSKFGESEVGGRLEEADLRDCVIRTMGITEKLHELGIVADVDRKEHDVFRLAIQLSSLVYVGMADCLIVAGALAARSDYFLTFDRPLRKLLDGLRKDKVLANRVLSWVSDSQVNPEARIPQLVWIKDNGKRVLSGR